MLRIDIDTKLPSRPQAGKHNLHYKCRFLPSSSYLSLSGLILSKALSPLKKGLLVKGKWLNAKLPVENMFRPERRRPCCPNFPEKESQPSDREPTKRKDLSSFSIIALMQIWFGSNLNKLAKLGDAIAISKSETINHSLTHWLTGVTARRCYRI